MSYSTKEVIPNTKNTNVSNQVMKNLNAYAIVN